MVHVVENVTADEMCSSTLKRKNTSDVEQMVELVCFNIEVKISYRPRRVSCLSRESLKKPCCYNFM